MNIEALHLQNLKRFSDLRIDLSALDTAPKLILLIGANGSGKSSIFDAFEYLSGPAKGLQELVPTKIAADALREPVEEARPFAGAEHHDRNK